MAFLLPSRGSSHLHLANYGQSHFQGQKKGNFPSRIVSSCRAGDYTNAKAGVELDLLEKLGVELRSTWLVCRTVRVDFLLSSELFPVELGGQGSILGKTTFEEFVAEGGSRLHG